jgi:RNA polymerase sigma-70 factor (ECF subfamily)
VRISAVRDHSQGVQSPEPPSCAAGPDLHAAVPDLIAAYVEHAPFVERVLRRAGVAERDVPDARQDVFVVAHRRLSSFEGRGRLSTWLYRIAWNVASEYRRRAYVRREQLGACSGDAEAALTAQDDDAQALRLEHRELLAHALHALDALDDDKREAFVLAEVLGLSMREVAARAGVPLKTAFSRAYAARRRVLATLRERGIVSSVLPAWLPLQWQRPPAPSPAWHGSGGTGAIAAQLQVPLIAFLCAALPGVAGLGRAPLAPTTTVAVAVATSAVAEEGVESDPAPAPLARIEADLSLALPAAPVDNARTRAATRHVISATASSAVTPSPASELIVVRDGRGWLVPAVDHPLDRAPSLRPLLPPIVHLHRSRAGFGQLPETLPAALDRR